ncbi:ATP synthase subunit d, mitochondrial [Chrysoperla carnea]|uniref:ATP synthase subunit d, mitochondrial n=1 Tax=Chrysoperla carnea TaxID=189513 RepID=UPI001D06BC56|nr:ATP synthase subunit d, mitochondrial [Chrysoperla carnea]
MAARRIAKSTINWTALAERVPENQKPNFQVFKAKSDGYLRRVFSFPENPPKLDWAYYKERIAVAGMADNFQKQYEALKVPYPEDKVSKDIDALEKSVKSEISAFVAESNKRISEYEHEINRLKKLVPYDQMTLEEYRDAYPEKALDPINRPTFWPHLPEDQLGYKAADAVAEKDH